MFEDAAIGIGKRCGVKSGSLLAKLIGYAWVAAWFVGVSPLVMEGFFVVNDRRSLP